MFFGIHINWLWLVVSNGNMKKKVKTRKISNQGQNCYEKLSEKHRNLKTQLKSKEILRAILSC